MAGQRKRQFHSRTHAIETLKGLDLSGKTYAITGTTTGIGVETARALVTKGAHVVLINRNVMASEEQKHEFLKQNPDAQIDIIECDLSSLQSVHKAASEYLSRKWPLHGLILNAGVMGPSSKTTSDGFEAHFGINHLAHFVLLRELLPVLRFSAPSRVVILSSHLHSSSGVKSTQSMEKKLSLLCGEAPSQWSYRLYSQSKMCNMLTAFKLHRDEHSNGVNVYSVHPGSGVRTGLQRDIPGSGIFTFLSKPFTKDSSQGAATSVYCVAHPEVENVSGKYWESCWDDEKSLDKKVARDEQLQDALWSHSEKLIEDWLATNSRSNDNVRM